jgi:hypothetical protein
MVLDGPDDPMVTKSLHVVFASVQEKEISVLGRASTRGDSGSLPERHHFWKNEVIILKAFSTVE